MNIKEIAEGIENGEIIEAKKLLMIADKTGWTVAHWLAYNSDETGWSTDDKNILNLQNKNGRSVADMLGKK